MTDHYKSMQQADWGTPADICSAARGFSGAIDLDPASSAERNKVVGATRWLGLEHVDPEIGIPVDWGNARHLFINPPGGVRPDRIDPITGKASGPTLASIFWAALCAHIEETETGSVTWVAYNINQLQTLQQENADLLRACCVCVPDLRVKYLAQDGKPRSGTPSASAFLGFAWGERASENPLHWTARFQQQFTRLGAVWTPTA